MAINSVFNSLLNSTEVISLWLYAWNNMVQFLYFVMAFYNIRELLHSKRSNVDYEVHMSSFRLSYPCYLIVLLFLPILVAPLLLHSFCMMVFKECLSDSHRISGLQGMSSPWWFWEFVWTFPCSLQMHWGLCEKQEKPKSGEIFGCTSSCCRRSFPAFPGEGLLFFLHLKCWFNMHLWSVWCRFAGYGRKSVLRMIGGSSNSWIMSSISSMAYYDMNVYLGRVLLALEGWVCHMQSASFSAVSSKTEYPARTCRYIKICKCVWRTE